MSVASGRERIVKSNEKLMNVEHRTSNIEHRIMYSAYFKKTERSEIHHSSIDNRHSLKFHMRLPVADPQALLFPIAVSKKFRALNH
jgi:hypothetical protein